MEPRELAREYYAAIDGDDYERLASLLAPSFSQERGDRTFADREEFVQFVREERPMTDTTHEIHGIVAEGDRVVVEGTLLEPSGDPAFAFADVFETGDDELVELRTYTR